MLCFVAFIFRIILQIWSHSDLDNRETSNRVEYIIIIKYSILLDVS